jgi:hypothetical protein
MTDHPAVRLDSIERAIADFRDGKAIVVVDDENRENEGDIIFAASKATPELMAFLVRYSSGLVCAPITGEILDRLAIPLMTPHNREKMRTAYTVSIDARDGITPARAACWPTPRPSPSSSTSRATSSRCAPSPEACSNVPATPRPPSTSRAWPG